LAPLRWRWPSLLAVATRKLLRPPRLPTPLLLLPLLPLLLLTPPLRLLTPLLRLRALRLLLRPKRRSSNRDAQASAIGNRVGSPALLVDPPGFFTSGVCSRTDHGMIR
jgi:hypothetical protein